MEIEIKNTALENIENLDYFINADVFIEDKKFEFKEYLNYNLELDTSPDSLFENSEDSHYELSSYIREDDDQGFLILRKINELISKELETTLLSEIEEIRAEKQELERIEEEKLEKERNPIYDGPDLSHEIHDVDDCDYGINRFEMGKLRVRHQINNEWIVESYKREGGGSEDSWLFEGRVFSNIKEGKYAALVKYKAHMRI